VETVFKNQNIFYSRSKWKQPLKSLFIMNKLLMGFFFLLISDAAIHLDC